MVVAASAGSGGTSPVHSSEADLHRLRLYHTHTGERIDIVYRRGDNFLPEAEEQLDHFLRDHRTGEVKHFDPRVFDILSDLAASVGHPGAEIQIICGYRTSWSNEFLRSRSPGVAKSSLHMEAHAIDIRISGVDTLTLRNAALRSSSDPLTAAGSSNGQWSRFVVPGKTGHDSLALSQTVIT